MKKLFIFGVVFLMLLVPLALADLEVRLKPTIVEGGCSVSDDLCLGTCEHGYACGWLNIRSCVGSHPLPQKRPTSATVLKDTEEYTLKSLPDTVVNQAFPVTTITEETTKGAATTTVETYLWEGDDWHLLKEYPITVEKGQSLDLQEFISDEEVTFDGLPISTPQGTSREVLIFVLDSAYGVTVNNPMEVPLPPPPPEEPVPPDEVPPPSVDGSRSRFHGVEIENIPVPLPGLLAVEDRVIEPTMGSLSVYDTADGQAPVGITGPGLPLDEFLEIAAATETDNINPFGGVPSDFGQIGFFGDAWEEIKSWFTTPCHKLKAGTVCCQSNTASAVGNIHTPPPEDCPVGYNTDPWCAAADSDCCLTTKGKSDNWDGCEKR